MSLIDLKSDLSKFRPKKPAPDPAKQSNQKTTGIDKDFGSKQPLVKLLKSTPILDPNPSIPKKQGVDVENAVPVKGRHQESIIEIRPAPKTFERTGKDVDLLGPTPNKTTQDTKAFPPTPNKTTQDAKPMPVTPNKTTHQPGVVNYFDDIASGTKGFVPNMEKTLFLGITGAQGGFKFNSPFQNTQLGLVDYFKNNDAPGFTSNISSTQYKTITGVPGNFNFKSQHQWTQLGLEDNFSNADALGFTPNRKHLDPTEFTGVTGQPGNMNFNRPNVINTILDTQNVFNNSAAIGFTSGLIHNSPSQFVGVAGSSYSYPSTLLSSYGFYNTRMPGIFNPGTSTVNYFNSTALPGGADDVATGFTVGLQHQSPSQFIGITGNVGNKKYAYPTVTNPFNPYGWFNQSMGNFNPKRSSQGTAVNYFNSTAFPGGADDVATGFTPGLHHLSPSQFIGITGNPGNMKYAYQKIRNPFNPYGWFNSNIQDPSSPFKPGLNKYDTTATSTNFFLDDPAKGFTPGLQHLSPSQFVGINANQTEYAYPALSSMLGGNYNWFNQNIKGTNFEPGVSPGTNFFNGYRIPIGIDDSATGFTIGMGGLSGLWKTQFKGVNTTAETYTFPPLTVNYNLDGDNWHLDRTNNKFSKYAGPGEITLQLGYGSPFKSFNGYYTAPPWHKAFLTFSNGQYKPLNPYLHAGAERRDVLLHRYSDENSPSVLDQIYDKYSLKDEAYNATYMLQPYVVRGIQRRPNKKAPRNQRWGLGNFYANAESEASGVLKGAASILEALDSGFMRGGLSTALHRSLFDIGRIGKFLLSPQGLTFMAKQIGLQNSNPAVEDYRLQKTRVWTPLNMLISAGGNAFGLHAKRHGILPIDPTSPNYEDIIHNRNDSNASRKPDPKLDPGNVRGNRLIRLRNELIDTSQLGILAKANKATDGFTGEKINVLSSIGGPKSVYGIGSTNFHRAVDSQTPNEYAPGSQKGLDNNLLSADNPIKKYSVLSYGKLEKGHSFNDYRNDIPGKSKQGLSNFIPSNGENDDVNYISNNLEAKFGWGSQGAPDQDKRDWTKESGRGDEVNKYDFTQLSAADLAKGTNPKDFIKFWFAGPNLSVRNTGDNNLKTTKDDFIQFRATLTGLTDNFTGTWADAGMIGRADPVQVYTGFGRDISFAFSVAATSREEMKPIWRKLNYLASHTAPDYLSDGKMKAPFMRLTIGDMYQSMPGFLTQVSFTISDESPWEINLEEDDGMMQLPHTVDVQISFTPVSDFRPQLKGKFFSLGKNNNNENDSTKNWLHDNSTIPTTTP